MGLYRTSSVWLGCRRDLFFMLALILFAGSGSVGQPTRKSAVPEEDDTDEKNIALSLQELNCACTPEVGGYLCQDAVLDQFEEYEWRHPHVQDFAGRFMDLYKQLDDKTFVLALQGEADAQTILKFKKWSVVEEGFPRRKERRDSDDISNQDLAWLRSVAVFKALRDALPEKQVIKYLEPLAHKSQTSKGGEYRATKVYIIGYEEGCLDAGKAYADPQ